jgi:hypothetical protein
MILVGSQRGGAGQLAAHLMNMIDNDHVAVNEVRGFMAEDLRGALGEAHAISKGTQCKQFLFSLSLNPPKDAEASIEDLRDAADRAEQALGLVGQPRALIIHEKNGRRHAHVVWSRIDAESMKAINLPHFKNRLNALSKELYLEQGWDLPDGYKTNGWKNPLNFTLAEWQQAKRLDLDPREIKQIFQQAWQKSDGLRSFRASLEEHGYFLAKGDRRGVVALDLQGEVYSVARWTGVRTKDLNTRLNGAENLPAVSDVSKATRGRLSERLKDHMAQSRQAQALELKPHLDQRRTMVKAHRLERARLQHLQKQRWDREAKLRAERVRGGLTGILDILTGRAREVRRLNDRELVEAYRRDRDQREGLYVAQRDERRDLQKPFDDLRARQRQERLRFARQVVELLKLSGTARTAPEREPARDARRRERDFGLEM